VAVVRITVGLRKLEFVAGNRAEAHVEFARASPLSAGETAHISLGMRDGRLRTLVGVPVLIEERTVSAGRTEYLYALSGQISEESAAV
jgi:hypothetical protein